jgi:hypothetical protein
MSALSNTADTAIALISPGHRRRIPLNPGPHRSQSFK